MGRLGEAIMRAFVPLATEGSEDLRGLRREYPEWGVWRSGTGRWWAFRTGLNPLTIEQLRAGCRLIVQADTLPDLRGMIQTETAAARRA